MRTEELFNYFPYDYALPETRDPPFAAHVALMPAPWNDAARLRHVGIKGYELDRSAALGANLVFLIDTSGSMDQPNKLPLLSSSFRLPMNALAPDDRIAIVTYAGSAGVASDPGRRPGGDPGCARTLRGGGLDRWRPGDSASLSSCRAAPGRWRRQPGHPRHRRGLQRRHHRS